MSTHEYAQRVGMIMQDVDALRKGLVENQAAQTENSMSQTRLEFSISSINDLVRH